MLDEIKMGGCEKKKIKIKILFRLMKMFLKIYKWIS